MAEFSLTLPDGDEERAAEKAEKIERLQNIKTPLFLNPDMVVTFYIGPHDREARFMVHKEAACLNSPVLKAAFNSQMIEGQTQTYRLEDTTADAFRYLLQFFYKGSINFVDHEEHSHSVHSEPVRVDISLMEVKIVCQLWVLGDKLLIPQVQNLVIDQLKVIGSIRPQSLATSVQYAYENTAEKSQLRRFLVQHSAWGIHPSLYSPCRTILPKNFLLDLVEVFSSALPEKARKDRQLGIDTTEFYVR